MLIETNKEVSEAVSVDQDYFADEEQDYKYSCRGKDRKCKIFNTPSPILLTSTVIGSRLKNSLFILFSK